jgi:hypothetical protein
MVKQPLCSGFLSPGGIIRGKASVIYFRYAVVVLVFRNWVGYLSESGCCSSLHHPVLTPAGLEETKCQRVYNLTQLINIGCYYTTQFLISAWKAVESPGSNSAR